mgnify:FL=1
MVTVLIVGALLAAALWVFKLYWRDICEWCAKTVRLASNVIKGVITFVKEGANVIAYLYRRLRNGEVEVSEIPAPQKIKPEQCPKEVKEALFGGKEVLVNEDVSRPVNI